ncbi:flagellin [Halorientalis salina]|uniref:flagellin n=1 Tax=Halorientalis salina TaxID=2932266 RepID=UPI0010AB9069|nr:flagellin [Halorientalis salina]
MGFSISGSAAIVFAGMFISFGIFYGATSNSFERVTDAQTDQTDVIVDEKNVAVEIVAYERIDSTDRLTILVNNTGARALAVDETDLFVDNEYFADAETAVNGDRDTTLWAPGEQLNVTVRVENPSRAKIVAEHGIGDTAIVSGDSLVVF